MLVILSDIDGLFTADPRMDKNAKLVHEVKHFTSELGKMSRQAGTAASTGGMFTKIQAAKQATASGITVIIANGQEKDVLTRLVSGEELGTMFYPEEGR